MLNNLYVKRLKRDLPRWAERGWISARHQGDILADASAGSGASKTPLITAIMGVVLIGGGIIMFFAANWDGMSKLTKMLLLLGIMWTSYAAAYMFLRQPRDLEQRTGQALLGLGLILFGANIMLVAQAFHIADRAPNGIMLWALGGLAGAWLLRSHVVAFIGILLATLWTSMELDSLLMLISEPAYAPWPYAVHWPFPFVWAGFAWLAHRHGWVSAARVSVAVMVWWLWMTFSNLLGFGFWDNYNYATGERIIFGSRLSFLLMASLFMLGRLAEQFPLTRVAALTLRNAALLGGLSFLYMSTTRSAFNLANRTGEVVTTPEAAGTALALLAAVLALIWRENRQTSEAGGGALPKLAHVTLALCALYAAGLVTWNFSDEGVALTLYVVFNALFLLAMAGLVQGGFMTGNRTAVNLGLFFFTVWILALYFDTFFGLMDRSIFFVGAGILLLGGGYLLQRQRRKLMARMKDGGGA